MASAVDNRHSNASPQSGNSKAPAQSAKKMPAASAEKKAGARSPISANSNPIAHEVQVTVSGARPCEVGGKRELFTEETSSVLVFESGGVLRLTAAVAAGQLLFLTNKQTKREVVAQVALKRDFKPTNCYVEVEFTEPSPGFWGIEFPEMPPEYVLLNPQQEKVAEQVQTAKPVAAKSKVPAPAPSAEEVAALKEQVEALREQLKSLQAQTVPEKPSAPVSALDLPHPTSQSSVNAPVVPHSPTSPLPELVNAASDALLQPQSLAGEVLPKMSAEIPKISESTGAVAAPASSALPIDRDVQAISDENLLPKPALDFSQARVTPKRASKSKHKVAASKRSGVVWKYLLLAALFLVAAGAAWYQNLVPGLPQPKNLFANAAPAASSSVVARPAPLVSTAPQKAVDTHSDSAKTTLVGDSAVPLPGAASPPAGAPSTALSSAVLPGPAKLAPETEAKPSASTASEAVEHGDAVPNVTEVPEKSVVGASSSKRSVPRTLSNTALVSATSSSDGATIVPPKLIKSVRAVAAPEALQDFATGDVKLDALVDATGRVKSMKALSGPASLRSAAMDALKEYRYEPARRSGRPVAAHVTVTIKFLFEP